MYYKHNKYNHEENVVIFLFKHLIILHAKAQHTCSKAQWVFGKIISYRNVFARCFGCCVLLYEFYIYLYIHFSFLCSYFCLFVSFSFSFFHVLKKVLYLSLRVVVRGNDRNNLLVESNNLLIKLNRTDHLVAESC